MASAWVRSVSTNVAIAAMAHEAGAAMNIPNTVSKEDNMHFDNERPPAGPLPDQPDAIFGKFTAWLIIVVGYV